MKEQMNELLNEITLYSSRCFPELSRIIHIKGFHSFIIIFLSIDYAMAQLDTIGDEKMNLTWVLF